VQCVDRQRQFTGGSCFAVTSTGVGRQCYTTDPNMLANISSITASSGDQLLLEFGGLLHQRAGLPQLDRIAQELKVRFVQERT